MQLQGPPHCKVAEPERRLPFRTSALSQRHLRTLRMHRKEEHFPSSYLMSDNVISLPLVTHTLNPSRPEGTPKPGAVSLVPHGLVTCGYQNTPAPPSPQKSPFLVSFKVKFNTRAGTENQHSPQSLKTSCRE